MRSDVNGLSGHHGGPIDNRPLRLVGLGGSIGRGAQSRMVLEASMAMAADHGAETVIADVRDLDLPVYNPDLKVQAYGQKLAWFLEEVRSADAILICSPTYHGTMSGALKNAIDYLQFLGGDRPPYLTGKAVGLMSVGGLTAVNTITALDHAVRSLNGNIAPTTVVIPNGSVDVAARRFIEPATRGRVEAMMTQVLELAEVLSPLRRARVREV
ncbi:MAG TPA: NAD(P)H-dependent oxidoreductase [Thermomicrobiales bacterium]|jgi:FMN reductase|nr:NAD(P)H-dependent oxidoreductase [Thermomicrobiales bacterium]